MESKDLERTVEDYDTEGMDSRWMSECTNDAEKQRTREMLKNSGVQFRLLKKILQQEFNQHQVKISDFESPNFDQKRIYQEGYLKALQVVYKILP